MKNVRRQFLNLGIAAVVAVVVGLVINYFALPAMTFASGGFWLFWFVELVVVFVTYCTCNRSKNAYGKKHIGLIITGGLAAPWLLVFVITAIASSEMVNPYEYQKIAQVAAEGLVSNMKYSASFPTILNVDGEETYFMTLKDAAGLVQRYALCNVKNYARCVYASSVEEVLYLYRVEMGFSADTDGNEEDDKVPSHDENRETKEVSGKVILVNEAQIEGCTYYYFMVEGETTIFMSFIENSNWQPVKLVEGVTVKINYHDSEESGIGIVTEITFEKS